MTVRILKKKYGVIYYTILYRIILDISYIFLITKIFSYEGFFLALDSLKIYESYLWLIFLLFICLFSIFENKTQSSFLLYIVFLFSYVPIGSFYGLADQSRSFFYYCTFFWLFSLLFYKFIPRFRIMKVNFSKKLFYFFILSINLLSFFLVYRYLGISFNFDLTLVYDIREKYIEAKIPFAGYIFNWTGYVFNPLLISYLFFRKRWIFLLLIIIWQMILFSQTGLKSFLFVPILVLGISWLYKKYGICNIFNLAPLGLLFVVILSILSYVLLNDIWLPSLLVRRILYVPARLAFYYYDFFSTNGLTYLSQHRLFRGLTHYPYHLDPPHLIGEIYFGTSKMAANNGILGDSYMNFGFWGIILWGGIFIILLKTFEVVLKNESSKILLGPLAVFVNVFVNSALLTSLTTHGFLIFLVLSLFLPKEEV